MTKSATTQSAPSASLSETGEITITFPSGRTRTIQTRPTKTTDPNVKPVVARTRRTQACVHVGKSIDSISTCRGPKFSSVWECSLHGRCAPLSLVQIGPGVVVCASCPDYEPAPEPTLIKLGLNFVSAIKRWRDAGKPVRTQERVNELLKICQACPFLVVAKKGAHCGKCGCPISGNCDQPTKSKICLATESCPLEPPRWTADD